MSANATAPLHGIGSDEHGWCPVCDVIVPFRPVGAWRIHEGHGVHGCPHCVRAILERAGFRRVDDIADVKPVTEVPQ